LSPNNLLYACPLLDQTNLLLSDSYSSGGTLLFERSPVHFSSAPGKEKPTFLKIAAGCVLLSNIYAAVSNRHLCENAEWQGREKGAKKQSGYS
jgi:hypothetical protein